MPGRKPPEIVLNGTERAELERLVRAHTTGQLLARRARVILAAADGLSSGEIARQVPMDVEAVGLWRRRWKVLAAVRTTELSAADRLADVPRPGAQPRLSPEQVCQIVALACEQPAGASRPISQWSHRELADEIIRRGITDHISPRHAARLLKSADLHRVRAWLTPPPTPIATPRSLRCVRSTAPRPSEPSRCSGR